MQYSYNIFIYFFQRWIRGILCDVWVAEKSSILGYQTTEIFFSRHDWNILVEEVNAHQELPIGMATYTADNVSDLHYIMETFIIAKSGSRNHCLKS
jgi:hypothetical protein